MPSLRTLDITRLEWTPTINSWKYICIHFIIFTLYTNHVNIYKMCAFVSASNRLPKLRLLHFDMKTHSHKINRGFATVLILFSFNPIWWINRESEIYALTLAVYLHFLYLILQMMVVIVVALVMLFKCCSCFWKTVIAKILVHLDLLVTAAYCNESYPNVRNGIFRPSNTQ